MRVEYINLVPRLSPHPDESSKYRCLIVLHSDQSSWGSDCRNMELGFSFVGVRGEPGNEAMNICDSCMWHKFKNWQSNHNNIITMGNSVLLMCQTGFVIATSSRHFLCDWSLKDCSNLMRRMNCMRMWRIHGHNIVSLLHSITFSPAQSAEFKVYIHHYDDITNSYSGLRGLRTEINIGFLFMPKGIEQSRLISSHSFEGLHRILRYSGMWIKPQLVALFFRS